MHARLTRSIQLMAAALHCSHTVITVDNVVLTVVIVSLGFDRWTPSAPLELSHWFAKVGAVWSCPEFRI